MICQFVDITDNRTSEQGILDSFIERVDCQKPEANRRLEGERDGGTGG